MVRKDVGYCDSGVSSVTPGFFCISLPLFSEGSWCMQDRREPIASKGHTDWLVSVNLLSFVSLHLLCYSLFLIPSPIVRARADFRTGRCSSCNRC